MNRAAIKARLHDIIRLVHERASVFVPNKLERAALVNDVGRLADEVRLEADVPMAEDRDEIALRFAVAAWSFKRLSVEENATLTPTMIVQRAYKMADAFLAEREKGGTDAAR